MKTIKMIADNGFTVVVTSEIASVVYDTSDFSLTIILKNGYGHVFKQPNIEALARAFNEVNQTLVSYYK